MAIPENITKHFIKMHPTGSRYICNPAPTDTDEDWICLTKDTDWYYSEYSNLIPDLLTAGYDIGGSDIPDVAQDSPDPEYGFSSWKCGMVNLIITDSVDFYNAFVEATEKAKAQNLLLKADRVELFQQIVYDNWE